MGSIDVILSSVIVKDASGNIVGEPTTTTDTLEPGVVTPVVFTAPPDARVYTVTLVSTLGGSFVSPSFTVSP